MLHLYAVQLSHNFEHYLSQFINEILLLSNYCDYFLFQMVIIFMKLCSANWTFLFLFVNYVNLSTVRTECMLCYIKRYVARQHHRGCFIHTNATLIWWLWCLVLRSYPWVTNTFFKMSHIFVQLVNLSQVENNIIGFGIRFFINK